MDELKAGQGVVIEAKFVREATGWTHVGVEHGGERYDFVVPSKCVRQASAPGGVTIDFLETHEFEKFYLGAGCKCGWRTQLMSEADCWPAWAGHIVALQRESQPPKPICCEQCGEEIKNKTYLCSNCWNRICTQRPAQAEAGRPTASAEKRLVAEYARNTPLAAPFQGEQDEWGEGYEAGEASERLKHSDPMLWLEEAFEAYRCLMREVNRRREAAAEQAGIEKGLEMAAKECDRVALMSMHEIEALIPGWTSSDMGSEILCSRAIRALASAAQKETP